MSNIDCDVFIDLYYPKNFFESVPNSSSESMSEQISKIVLSKIHNIPEEKIVRGDASKSQPDYLIDEIGYEITFACSKNHIKAFKGKGEFSSNVGNIRYLEEILLSSIQRKARKKYSVPTNVVLFVAEPFAELYSVENVPIDLDVENEETGEIYRVKKFLSFGYECFPIYSIYRDIYSAYINNGIFENVLILMMDCNSTYKLIDIKKLIESKNIYGATKTIGAKNSLLPHCQVEKVQMKEKETYFPAIKYYYRINWL